MKKILALVLALAMVLGLAACGSKGSGSGSGSQSGSQTSNSDFKVGAIYINKKSDTAGYTYAHHTGITKAMKELGMDPETQLVIVDQVPEDDTQVGAAVDTLVGEGCSIIFGISFGYLNEMEVKAQEYPDVIFSHATGFKSNDTNYNNYFGRIYQARYLAGIAAGLKSLETGNNNIGYVSAYDTEYAETCSGINGFTLGVQAVNPNATVYVKELGTWTDEVNEYAFAEELIKSYGCGVIAQHCDTEYPQTLAQERGVYSIGYNSDMSKNAPEACLCSVIWNWSAYYTAAVQSLIDGTWDGSNYYGGMNENLVGLTNLADFCAEGTQEKVDEAKEQILSGQNGVFDGVIETNTGETVGEAGKTLDDATITGGINWYFKTVNVVD